MSAREHSYADAGAGPALSGARAARGLGPAGARAPAPATWLWAAAGTVGVQLATLLALAGTLNLWALSRNGWANEYYSAAVRSMSSSWHNFLFASMDPAGVMSVDKPPLALWVQALSVRAFGYHPASILVPQAAMGMLSVALVYDLVRRRFGRLGGFVAGLALALTPISVAISRHNNPDALLVLCCLAALWCTVRALDRECARGRVRWLALAGVCVGLGFETKMGVALMVVPGIAAAWLWVAPNGRRRAPLELLGAGGAMALVGGAWPALVELTPARDRPWVSGTSGNRVWELITEYNGVGRLYGQTGGPGGASPGGGGQGAGAGTLFGGSSGPLRLLGDALGGQAGWLLGFALLSALAVLVASRLRRGDRRSGWLIAVGGAFVLVAIVFSEARGIFHPYYVSFLAPFAAALTGAGVAQLRERGRLARAAAPAAIVAGVVCELAILHDYPGQLAWLAPVLIVTGAGAALALAVFTDRRIRTAALGCGVAALLLAPGIWAVDTLGYATNGTFPSGGPRSALNAGFARSGPGGRPDGGAPGGPRAGAGLGRTPPLAGTPPVAGPGAGGPPGLAGPGLRPGLASPGVGAGGPIGAPLGNRATIVRALTYAEAHGGGTVAVASQSSAAPEIVSRDAQVAGIGGFSGRESDVGVGWLADEVATRAIRWVLSEGTGLRAGAPRLPGDTRQGSRRAIAAVTRACVRVTLTGVASRGGGAGGARGEPGGGAEAALYDCSGRAAALRSTQQSRS